MRILEAEFGVLSIRVLADVRRSTPAREAAPVDHGIGEQAEGHARGAFGSMSWSPGAHLALERAYGKIPGELGAASSLEQLEHQNHFESNNSLR